MKSVLIPFIAGQWSLRARALEKDLTRAQVLIPFIAGQWSLRPDRAKRLENQLES